MTAMNGFANWNDFLHWLDARNVFHMDLDLGRIRRALKALGLARPGFAVIQVLGSNGKGSTATFIASLARTHGLRTGLYTSPHFVSMEERILIDGQSPGRAELLACASQVAAASAELTWFEFVTALAMLAFARGKARLAVLEAGLGGASDATTAVPAIAHCFTPMAMDHAAIIGPTLQDIALDKARAIRAHNPVYSAAQYPQAAAVLEACARKAGSCLSYASSAGLPPEARLRGRAQAINAGLALAAWRGIAPLLGVTSSLELEKTALKQAFIPGRMQHIPAGNALPELILDGAHNPHGMQCLLKGLDHTPECVIYSALADKDWRACAAMLARGCPRSQYFIPQIHNERGARAYEIAAFMEKLAPGRTRLFAGADSVALALRDALAAGGLTLLTGSLYLLAEFYVLYPEYLDGGSAPARDNNQSA